MPRLGERPPQHGLVAAAEAQPVGRQHRVAGVEHRRAARRQQEAVEHDLRPASVARALVGRQPALRALQLERLVARREPGVVLVVERLGDVEVGGAPDLAVGVRRGGAVAVVLQVGVVERAVVHAVVADAALLVAGDVRRQRERVGTGTGRDVLAPEVLGEDQVRPALGLALGGTGAGVGTGDHPVADRVAVLVRDHRHVVGTVGAGGVERAGERLPEVLVGDRRDAVLQRQLVGVVAAVEGTPAGLRVADLGVVLPRRGGVAEVGHLHVGVQLGEPEVVAPVVHPVVADEEVGHRGVVVVAAAGHVVERRSGRSWT